MRVVEPERAIRLLMDRFESCGGVLDFVFVDVEGEALPAEQLHRQAAALSLDAVKQRIDRQAERIARDYGGKPEGYPRVTVPPGYTPMGRSISLREFLGPLYTLDQRLLPAPKTGLYMGETAGFAYAFTRPPYNLSEAEKLFPEFQHLIFADFPPDTQIWQWDTDSCNYFDAGREWWGTFFWTVRPSKETCIIGILGSSTD